MKERFSTLGLALLGLLTVTSCRNDEDDELIGNWVKLSDMHGNPRSNAASFVVDGLGFLTGGYDGDKYYNDTWAYNPSQNTWSQKADFPGGKRSSAVGFATSSFGYVGTGYDGLNKLNDFYKYNPKNNSWERITDFPGTGRYAALGFGIDKNGYVGTGYDGNELKDFYKYDETTNTWKDIGGIGGSKRRDGAVFVINNTAYVGFGTNNGTYVNDFWAFNPSTEEWTRKANTKADKYDLTRSSPAAFSMGGNGYITAGTSKGVTKTTWMYSPSSNTWTQKTDFEGSARERACAFSIKDYGYVVAGNSGSSYFDDIWVFHPNEKQNNDD